MTPMDGLDPNPPICVIYRLRRPTYTSVHYDLEIASAVAKIKFPQAASCVRMTVVVSAVTLLKLPSASGVQLWLRL